MQIKVKFSVTLDSTDHDGLRRLSAAVEYLGGDAVINDCSLVAAEPPSEEPETPAIPVTDAAGLPWDSRIHTESRALNKDGTWRVRRNTDPEYYTRIVNELRAAMAAPSTPVSTMPEAGSDPSAPPPPVESPATAAPSAPPPPVARSFPELMQALLPKLSAGIISQAQVDAACAGVGVPNLPALNARPDLIEPFAGQLDL